MGTLKIAGTDAEFDAALALLEANENGGEQARAVSAASKLVALAQELELFHDQEGNGFAVLSVAGHKETYSLRSRSLRSWLSRRYFESGGRVAGSQAFQDALTVLEGRALFEGAERKVHVRVAGVEHAVYLDLGDESWRCVAVTRDGWKVVTDPPVRFRRTRGMLPLPLPVRGSASEIRRFVNVADEDAERLLLAWLVAALNPSGPYPILCLVGEHGCAKSTTSRVVRALIDPSSSPLRSLPRDERDLMIAAKNSWCLAFDNLSGIPPWVSDAFCRIATGGGFATRELFTDDGEAIFCAQRPVLVNGIDDLATRPDLLDRAIVLTLPAIEETARRTEEDFWRDFDAARPRLLGALLDGFSAALRNRASLKLEKLPRMADFALWASAAEPAFSWPKGAFLEAYAKNRGEASESGLETDPIAAAIRSLAAKNAPWSGSASALLEALEVHVLDSARKARDWPSGPKALTDRLRRLAPPLRAVGVHVKRGPRTGRGRSWLVERAAHA